MEKRIGRREIEGTRRRRGGVKSGETNLASNLFPKCSPQPRAPKTHYWTLLCTLERRDPAPPTRTQMQAPLTRKP